MIFYSDVDDTLMLKGNPSNYTDQFLKEDINKFHFIPCSGRPTSNLITVFSKYNISHVIGFNGAQIYDLKNNEIIYENGFTLEEVEEITKLLENLNIDYILYDENKLYTNNLESQYINVEKEITLLELKKIKTKIKSPKILGACSPDNASDNIEKLRLIFPNLEISKSKPYFIEITKKGSTKGRAIYKLNEILAQRMTDTYVFGDSDNDITMFELEANKIAVANANNNILQKSDQICESCESDGVAKYIKNLIKQKEKDESKT